MRSVTENIDISSSRAYRLVSHRPPNTFVAKRVNYPLKNAKMAQYEGDRKNYGVRVRVDMV